MIDRDDPADAPDVLLVESSDDAVRRVNRAVETGDYELDLHVVPDAAACLAFLRRRDAYADAPNPGLVVLGPDVGARRTGSETEPESASDAIVKSESDADATPNSESPASRTALLETIAGDPDLRRIPVVVCLPSTATDETIRRCYDRRANAVVVLADGEAAAVEDFRSTLRFWIAAARLPNVDRLG